MSLFLLAQTVYKRKKNYYLHFRSNDPDMNYCLENSVQQDTQIYLQSHQKQPVLEIDQTGSFYKKSVVRKILVIDRHTQIDKYSYGTGSTNAQRPFCRLSFQFILFIASIYPFPLDWKSTHGERWSYNGSTLINPLRKSCRE